MTLTNASSSSQFGSQACRSARWAIVDDGAVVFDSNAILLYLAEKTGKFLPESTPKARGELLS
jgi:hypothetical protein